MIKADRNEHANVAAAPEGRLWLMWEVNGTIFAARTNKAATRVGAVNALRAPGSRTVYRLNGEGSAGPLDLFVNDGSALWHQQVWPKLQLTASRSGGNDVSGFSTRETQCRRDGEGGRADPPDRSQRPRHAEAGGRRVKATASKAGYAPASSTVR